MRRTHVLIRSLLLTLAGWLAAQGASAATFPAGFSESEILRPDGAATWNEAVGMTFQANGRLWVWERGGRVWIVDDGNPVTTPVIDLSPEVGAWTDHGMLGFALHPDFDATGYIYLLYVVDRHHLLNCDSPAVGAPVCSASYSATTNQYNAATIGRLVRYRAVLPAGQSDYRNARTIDLSSRRTLLGETLRTQPKSTGCPILHSSHGVGSLVFGMDGTLLVSCGDGASFTSTDAGSAPETYYSQALADGIIRSAENVGAFRSQMLNSHAGKILRLDPDTGDGLASNPFYNAAAPRSPRSRVWALGVRNGFRFTLRPLSGSHNPSEGNPGVVYLGDVGWATWEDLDVVRGGENLGWPLFEGHEAHSTYTSADPDNLDEPNPRFGIAGCTVSHFSFTDLLKQDTLKVPSWPNPCNASQQITSSEVFLHTRPALDWRHDGVSSRWAAFDEDGDPLALPLGTAAPGGMVVTGTQFSGSSSQGGVWYTGEDFPAEYRNLYFHGDYSAQWIRGFVFDQNNVLHEVKPFMTGGGGVVDIATNPVTGGLYYNSWTAFVRKISYSPTGNVPPVAVATATPTFGTSPLTVQFDASGSTDSNGQPLTYSWNFDDGSPASTSPNPSHTFTAPAGQAQSFDVVVTVRDPGGLTSQRTLLISVNNTPPTATITSPPDGAQYTPGGGNIIVPLSATISDAQTPTAQLSCQWLVVLHHNTHQHEEPVINSCSSSFSLQPIGCDGESYFYRFALTVTDPQGLSTLRESRMYPTCGGNQAPSTSPDGATVARGGSATINVLTNDTDADGLNPASVTIVSPPSGGTITGISSATGAVTYQHGGGSGTSDSFTYTVADSTGLTSAVTQVTLAITQPVSSTIRVNTGGPQYTDSASQVWAADFGFTGGVVTTVSNSIFGTSDPALYQNDRWDPDTAPEMSYAFAVPNGNYTVKLHFVEHWSGGQSVGARIFDVLLENTLVLDNLDIFAQAGGYTLLVKTLQTTVSDGQLNINFVHGSADDPIIGAIEILSSGGGSPSDTQPPTVPQNLTGQAVSASQVTLAWSAATDNGGGSVAGYRIFRNGTSIGTSATTSFTDNTVVASTTYTYRVAAFDNASPANQSAQSTQVSVTTPATQPGSTTIRVNAGGPQYTDSASQVWAADFGFTGGVVTTVSNSIFGTSDPALYQNDRWDPDTAPEMSYAFAVPNGNYTVKLHFVEHWSGGQSVGARIFDVLLENTLVLDNLDIFAQAGGYTLLVKTLQTTVSDGQLNINFVHGSADDPIIGAIEILSSGGGSPSDTQPPTVPQNLTGQAVSANQVTLAWSAATDNGGGSVAGYRIFRNGTSIGTSATTSFADNTVVASTTYTYRVAAFDNASPANQSAQSTQVSVTTPTPVDTQPPTVPQNLTGQAVSASQVTLAWSAATDNGGGSVAGYRIFRNGTSIGTSATTSFADNTVVASTTYTYRVAAFDNASPANQSAQSTQISVTTPTPVDTQPPTVPQNLTGQAVSASQVTLGWSAATDNGGGSVAGYRIFRNGTSIGTSATTSFADNTVAASTTYTYRVAAFDNASPANQSAQSTQISVTTPATQPGSTTIRVNAGGPQYTDSASQVWAADFGFTGGAITTVSNTIFGTSDPTLYRSDRWDPDTAPEMSYAFAVPNGNYTVKLHFVEHWSGGQSVGARIFDVLLENTLVLDNLDIFAQAGGYTLLVKTLQTTVSDGQLNINFVHGSADDPIIGAIEILSSGGGSPSDTQPPTVPQNLTGQAVSASQVTLAWSAATDNGGGSVAGYRIFRNGTSIGTSATTSFADNTVVASTTYTYRVAAFDNASPANQSAQSTQVSVTTPAAPPASTTIRVNTGGPQYTDSASQVWAADFGFTGGAITTVSNTIFGTSDPTLYRSDRWDPDTAPEMSYAFAVPNGNYTVKLHFVEHWSGGQSVGARIFDVLLENTLVLDNLDIFAQAGGYTLLVKTLQTTVSDGQLNINFVHGSADDPIIGAIEILSN